MKLKYIDVFKFTKNKEIKNLYIDAFPKEERYPFWLVKNCAKSKNVEFNVITENENLIGFEYLLFNENDVFLFYLVIDKSKRKKGYGSKVLEDLIEKYKEKNIILCVERIKKSDKEDIKEKRKKFYLRNGFFETNIYTEDNGVEYEVLCTNKDYKITGIILSNLYKKMSERFFIGKIMKRMFNVENARIIE